MAEYKQLSLRESAKHDWQTGQKEKLTGWGKICALRASTGVSRKAKRKHKP